MGRLKTKELAEFLFERVKREWNSKKRQGLEGEKYGEGS
jgi:hypothetical protein